MTSTGHRAVDRVAPALFFATGLAGLLLQVAWFRMLALSLGGTLAAATVTLAAFMAGLALGGALFARRAHQVDQPLRAYGWLEIGAGLLALASPLMLRVVDVAHAALAGWAGDHPAPLMAAKILLAGLVLIPPTACMGATLPALAQGLVRRAATSGGGAGGLAAINTMGAVAGTLLALFVVLPRFGLTACVLIAAGIDLAAGVIVLALSRSAEGLPRPETAPPPARLTGLLAETRGRALALALMVTGATGMAYEVLWTRALAFSFGSGAQAFGLMLAVVLLGWAVGAFLGGEAADRTGRPLAVLAWSQALLVLAVAWQIWKLPQLPDFLYLLAVRWGGVTFESLSALMLLGAVQVLLPAAVLMGMAFPAGVRALASDGGAGDAAGFLGAANALGTIPGAALAAWVLIPAVGLQRALLAVAAVNLLTGLLIALAEAWSRGRTATAPLVATLALGGVLVGLLAVQPWRIYSGSGVFRDDGDASTLLAVNESPHGAVTLSAVEDSRGSWLSLSVDAVNVAGTSPPLLACQEMQGQVPLLLHAHPRRVLHVGFGSGGTARAVTTHASVERVDVVEINPAVLRLADEQMRIVNEGVLDDPRVHVRIEDGRNFLRWSTETWDCILSDSIHPRYRGNASLYSVEYFRTCRERLAPGGLVSTWLPVYSLTPEALRSIIASMREVFPRTSVWYLNSTINEFVILVGRTEDAAIDVARMERAMEDPFIAASLARVGVRSAVDVIDYLIAEGEDLGALASDCRLNHDDVPWVELESAAILDRDGSWRVNLEQVINARRPAGPVVRGATAAWFERLEQHERATTSQLRGQLALLRRDPVNSRIAFAEARAHPGFDGEPWEAFGAPPWVASIAMAPAAQP